MTHTDDCPASTSHVAGCSGLHATKASESDSMGSSKQQQARRNMQQCSVANSAQMGSHADGQHGKAAASSSQSCVQAEQQRLQPSMQCRGAEHGTCASQTAQKHACSGSRLVSSCQRLTPCEVLKLQKTHPHYLSSCSCLCQYLLYLIVVHHRCCGRDVKAVYAYETHMKLGRSLGHSCV